VKMTASESPLEDALHAAAAGRSGTLLAAGGNPANGTSIEDVFRQRMRAMRGVRRMSQRTLAEALALAGVKLDYSAIARIEHGRRGISLDEAVSIAYVLRVPLVEMLTPVEGDSMVRLTPHIAVAAEVVRLWAAGGRIVPRNERVARILRSLKGRPEVMELLKATAESSQELLPLFAELEALRAHPDFGPATDDFGPPANEIDVGEGGTAGHRASGPAPPAPPSRPHGRRL
jgi:transcriptional regulator with XRE-family HTH domain